MAKRQMSSDKWKSPWFKNLESRFKVVWDYLYLDCDCAGIWLIDMELLRFQTNEKVTLDEMFLAFGNKIILIDNAKLLLTPFFAEQYSQTKDSFAAKRRALDILKAHGVDIVNIRGGHSPHTPPSLPPQSPQPPCISSSNSISNSISKRAPQQENFCIPEDLMQALIVQEQYPKEVITEVAKDAWLLYLASEDIGKKWPRFLAHYFRNEKGSIRDFLARKSKAEKEQENDLSAGDILRLLEGEG